MSALSLNTSLFCSDHFPKRDQSCWFSAIVFFFSCSPDSCSAISGICLDGVQTSKMGPDLHMPLGFTKGELPRILFSMRAPPGPPWLRLLCSWDSLGKNTGVGCHALLQGIFLTQGRNPCLLCLLHWQMGSLPLAQLGIFIGFTNIPRKAINTWNTIL